MLLALLALGLPLLAGLLLGPLCELEARSRRRRFGPYVDAPLPWRVECTEGGE